jgi:hypothetical protein
MCKELLFYISQLEIDSFRSHVIFVYLRFFHKITKFVNKYSISVKISRLSKTLNMRSVRFNIKKKCMYTVITGGLKGIVSRDSVSTETIGV